MGKENAKRNEIKEEISLLSNVTMAFSTFVGVGGAIAYYMKEIRDSSIGYIILTEIIYLLAMIILLMSIKNKLK